MAVKCADCSKQETAEWMYFVLPPCSVSQGPFFLCKKCWDAVIGAATLQALR